MNPWILIMGAWTMGLIGFVSDPIRMEFVAAGITLFFLGLAILCEQ